MKMTRIQILQGLLLLSIAFTSFVVYIVTFNHRRSGGHDRFHLGNLELDIDHSGFPGDDPKRQFIRTKTGIFYGNGLFSFGLRLKSR